MLKAIFFDLGNTLLDFEPMDTQAVFRCAALRAYTHLQSKGYTLPEFDPYYRMHVWAMRWAYLWSRLCFNEFNSMAVMRRMCQKLKLEMNDQQLLEYGWFWYAPAVDHSSIEPDLIHTLQLLRALGLKLAIVSNTVVPGAILDRHMKIAGLFEFFPWRIYSSEAGVRKPDPRIFEIALEAVGVSPQETMFVGDTVKTDIVGARRVGLTAILKQPHCASRTHPIADHVIRRIADLKELIPQARHQLSTPPSPADLDVSSTSA